ncbi:YesL family protein [Salipaludibacillus daqingensis]|uniref:YesL family protein n=1 Tax=Salipaludibacillus daqingensis TaxID=3041001 RepID=UPI00247437EF|nr:DUF624 domain-containing protein [Salipaludibacillus daqingensis]
MQQTGTSGFIYRVADWMMKLAFVNLLWILFTILGFGVFGFYPAWIAMCRLMTLWSKGEEPPLFKTFWSVYRTVFLKANAIALGIIIMFAVIFVNLNIVSLFGGFFFYFYSISTFILLIVLILWTFVFGLVSAEKYKVAFSKIAFVEPIKRLVLSPGKSIVLILAIGVIYLLNGFIPGLLPVYSVSLICWVMIFLFVGQDVTEEVTKKPQ